MGRGRCEGEGLGERPGLGRSNEPSPRLSFPAFAQVAACQPRPLSSLAVRPFVLKTPSSYLGIRSQQLRLKPTWAESELWQRLRACRLDGLKFRRQQAMGKAIVDFYCHALRLAVEVDGAVHSSQRAEDMARDCELNRLGVRVLRFANEDVIDDVGEVLEAIRGWAGLPANPSPIARASPQTPPPRNGARGRGFRDDRE